MKDERQKFSEDRKSFFRILGKPEVIASLALILSFFLTWFSNPIFSVPAYKISRMLEFVSIPQPVHLILNTVSFLIPIGGLVIILLAIIKKSTATVAMIVGMLPIIMIVVLYFYNHFILKQLALGSVMAVIAAVVLLITGALKSPGF